MEEAELESDDFFVIVVGQSDSDYVNEDKMRLEGEGVLEDSRDLRNTFCVEDDNVEEMKKPIEVMESLVVITEPLEVTREPMEVEAEREEVGEEALVAKGGHALVMEYVHAMEAHAKAGHPPLTHIPYKKVEDQHVCMYCPHVTPNEKRALKHYRFRHGKKYHKCLGCNSGYRRHDTMLFHETYCKAENANLVRLAREMYNKRKLPPMDKREWRAMKMPCKICNKVISRGNMKLHLNLHTDKEGMKIPCKICGKLITRGNMNLHLNVHSVDKRFACPHCTAKFRTNSAKLAHVNAHFGIRPYRCDECPKAYTSDNSLRAHKLDHEGRLYYCEYCERKYKRKHNLKEHLATHEDGNKYLCNECGKVIISKMAMEQHTRAHRGETRRYTCVDCGKSYTQITTLNDHMKRKHGCQIITRKMFFKKLPTLVDVSDFTGGANSKCEEQADDPDDPDDISNGSIGDTDAVDNEDVDFDIENSNTTNEVD